MLDFLKNTGNSKLQETLAEYAFIKDLLIDGIRNNTKVLISRSDFDVFGYDILVQIENNKRIIKLQLKATNGKVNDWDIHKSLLEDNDGNVILINITVKDNDLRFEYYSILNKDRNHILSRKPKKAHPKKCKLIKGDLTFIENKELLLKILN